MNKNKNERIVLVAGSGRTGQGWLCNMLSYYLNARFVEPYCLLRGILHTEDNSVMEDTAGRLKDRKNTEYDLVVKTHEYPDEFFSLTSKVILLVRDPRDVVASAWLRHKTISETGSDLESGLRDKSIISKENDNKKTGIKNRIWIFIHSFKKLSVWRTAIKWKRFIYLWGKVPTVYSVRFEDLKENPVQEITNIMNYLQVEINIDMIKETINRFNIHNMKSQSSTNSDHSITVRKGKVGGYKRYLDRIDIYIIQRICNKIATKIGYKTY
ncbi:sulfotransferase domain-containing protein [bacterium]|nr:sulfotransferase domain-containing protein [bacterium]